MFDYLSQTHGMACVLTQILFFVFLIEFSSFLEIGHTFLIMVITTYFVVCICFYFCSPFWEHSVDLSAKKCPIWLAHSVSHHQLKILFLQSIFLILNIQVMLEYLFKKEEPYLCTEYKNSLFLSYIVLHSKTDELSGFTQTQVISIAWFSHSWESCRLLWALCICLATTKKERRIWRIPKQVLEARWKCWSHGRRNEVSD